MGPLNLSKFNNHSNLYLLNYKNRVAWFICWSGFSLLAHFMKKMLILPVPFKSQSQYALLFCYTEQNCPESEALMGETLAGSLASFPYALRFPLWTKWTNELTISSRVPESYCEWKGKCGAVHLSLLRNMRDLNAAFQILCNSVCFCVVIRLRLL